MKQHTRWIIGVISVMVLTVYMLTREKDESVPPVNTETKSSATIQTKKPITDLPTSEAEFPSEGLQGRKDAKQKWMSAVRQVVEMTQDPEARAIYQFLSENSFLVESFGPNSLKVLEGIEAEYPIALLILTKNDLEKDVVLKERVERFTETATFSEDPPTIILYPIKMSAIWRGITLLHEGSHALLLTRTPDHNPAHRQAYAREEVRVHEFENRLLTKLGGEAYKKFLEKEVVRIKEIEDSQQLKHNQMIVVSRTDYNHELDNIFEKALTQQERDLRQTHVHIHAQFTLIERRYAGDPHKILETKAQWYDALRPHNANEP